MPYHQRNKNLYLLGDRWKYTTTFPICETRLDDNKRWVSENSVHRALTVLSEGTDVATDLRPFRGHFFI